MAAEIHQEGMQYLQECGYSEEQTPPASFTVGLCTDASPAEDASVADLTEISDSGYARQTINSDNTDCVSATAGTNDRKTTFKTVTFTNSSGSSWTAVNAAFLTTAADDSGKLLMTIPITGAPNTIADGESLDVTFVHQSNG